ncbi:hypothetical protein BKK79_37290 (plasmid) [Cupriavidus sp. USMAA2-4]|uniref:hypothetical protein n=1 Tax=Cupriavidus sp. USMAA2-4 TaxID=876364 RepID=UPI0008A6FDF2|nr:hypothetical protein [Cupriavidus sp. USMAA2-4]AOY97592.1 hypothetical protein BKK79_37290 [Cupriavidus sp. USMAA2-4]
MNDQLDPDNALGRTEGASAPPDELDLAAADAGAALAGDKLEVGGIDLDKDQPAQLPETEDAAAVQAAISRARNQRERGKRELLVKVPGIPSVQRHVVINEQVVASSFTRFFYIIDRAADLIRRRAGSLVGDANASALRESLQSLIADLEADVKRDLAATREMYRTETQAHAQNDYGASDDDEQLIEVTYVAPGYDETIQIRSAEGLRLQGIYGMYDQLLGIMANLEWNGKIDSAEVDQVRYQTKARIRPIFRFAAQANIKLHSARNKAAGPRPRRARQTGAEAKGDTAIVQAVTELQERSQSEGLDQPAIDVEVL